MRNMNFARNVIFFIYLKFYASYGFYPELRVLLYNNYGYYYRRKKNT